jgi:uroporphyrinogen-III synthase
MSALSGRSILLTRSADDCRLWSARLAERGAKTVELPCIDIEFVAAAGLADDLRAALTDAAWLILTSKRGVEALEQLGLADAAARLAIAVVGSQTAASARARLGRVDFIGNGTSAGLAAELLDEKLIGSRQKAVLAVAEGAGSSVEDRFDRAGIRWQRFDSYRTTAVAPREPRLKLSALAATDILFASPGAVTGFSNQVTPDCRCRSYSIGPTTTAAMRRQGIRLTAEAREPSLAALIERLEETTHA